MYKCFGLNCIIYPRCPKCEVSLKKKKEDSNLNEI